MTKALITLALLISLAQSAKVRSKAQGKNKNRQQLNKKRGLSHPGATRSLWPSSDIDECYNFDNYAPGTIVDNNYQPEDVQLTDMLVTSQLLSGIEIRVNQENENAPDSMGEGATLVVVKGDTLPFVYDNNENGTNSCGDGTSRSGIGLMPRKITDEWWGKNNVKVEPGKRKKFSKRITQIAFTFPHVIDKFEVTTSDLGDWNAVLAKEAAKVKLIGYDSNGAEVARAERELDIHLGRTVRAQYDGCNINSVLYLDAKSSIMTSASLEFESAGCVPDNRWISKRRSCSDSQFNTKESCLKDCTWTVHDHVFDPNFHIAQICYPNAGGGFDDPHFVGFDGSTYDFKGLPGVVFNLISDFDFQLNSEFIQASDKRTYMGKLAFTIGKNEVLVTPALDGAYVEINGQNVTEKQILLQDNEGNGVGVVHTTNGVVSVSSGSFNIKVERVQWGEDLHLNFHASVQSQQLGNPHGVLGQTAQFLVTGISHDPVHLNHNNQDAAGFIEGNPIDYMVADGLWGTSFKFNRYHPHQATRPTNVYRGNRHAVAFAGKQEDA